MQYDFEKAVEYAIRWANGRNPDYFNFDSLGGDCTNFASQCLYAGSGIMNYTKDFGWYYISLNDRAPAWTGAEYFRRFLLNNKSLGPMAEETKSAKLGDFIQLGDESEYYHTLIVTGFSGSVPLVCAHTNDAFMRRLDTYCSERMSILHIIGANSQ